MTRPRLTLSEVHQKLQAQKDGAKQRTFFEDLEDKLEAEHRKLLEKDRKEKLEKLEKKLKKKSKKRKRSHDSSSDDSKKLKKEKKKKKKKEKDEKRKDEREERKKKRKSKDKSGPVKLSEFFQSSDDSSEESSIDSIKETERNKKFGDLVTESKSAAKKELPPKEQPKEQSKEQPREQPREQPKTQPREQPREQSKEQSKEQQPQKNARNESLSPEREKVSEITTTGRQFVPVEFPTNADKSNSRSLLDRPYQRDAPYRYSDHSRGHRPEYTESYRSRRPPAHPYHRQGDYPSYDQRDYLPSRHEHSSRSDHNSSRNTANDRRGPRGKHEPDWEKPL